MEGKYYKLAMADKETGVHPDTPLALLASYDDISLARDAAKKVAQDENTDIHVLATVGVVRVLAAKPPPVKYERIGAAKKE